MRASARGARNRVRLGPPRRGQHWAVNALNWFMALRLGLKAIIHRLQPAASVHFWLQHSLYLTGLVFLAASNSFTAFLTAPGELSFFISLFF